MVVDVDGNEIGLAKVTQIATRLAQGRYVLQGDIPGIVEAAGKHWDCRVAGTGSR